MAQHYTIVWSEIRSGFKALTVIEWRPDTR